MFASLVYWFDGCMTVWLVTWFYGRFVAWLLGLMVDLLLGYLV